MNDRYGSGPGVLCKVCGDRASGKHYGVPSCDGCRGFFKRSIRRNLEYVCKEGGKCVVDVSRRNQCQACRFAKCIQANMRREAVQHERAPKIPNVTQSNQSLTYANIYGARHQEGIFPFQMHLSSPLTFPLDNYYIPSPYYPHLTESLNLKFTQNVYKPHVLTTSSYDLEIEKMLTSNLLMRKTNIGEVKNTESSEKITKEKENEVTSSEEIQLLPLNDSNRLKSTQTLYDSATKLLFLSIRWAKSIPSFNQLPICDQKKMLNESWAELFVVAASQWGLTINEELLVSVPFLRTLQNVIKHFASLKVDHFEAACLKALILFRSDAAESSTSMNQIVLLQNQTLCLLIEKCGSLRYGHLLLMLPPIKFAGNAQNLQENLFKHTIGEIFIEKILEDL